ncbi:UDP-N-acetylmuramoyl-tripeptide--D-alanyl-D-alanine ligase [Hwanghaeella grinnelliae]|uniref:UDP-N-acetylmuramoyl-tripeptide--D-alanyl-D-alanine ligase n=1 Tax=Hwanghaeella grinnelliae TaxID=2500179 RepID=A0A3S2Y0W3_9PROT|nr:UDP-N-acetylmuramoyl-tripeptide--D-alanyl-D-alanine ligase [Hwanghaeella grinnelliae]RVU34612.1 UDP-N-acetylmuramoyl-tripeptide--D-alanyl-D-alanine ligase [Hwanghaeella grinnelliae]
MTALWTETTVEEATNGRSTAPFSASGVQIDSRFVQPGDLFIAIRGAKQDGHAFIDNAAEAGAAAAVVAKDWADKYADRATLTPLHVVDDTFDALYDLARSARARTHAKLAAVTGSMGKTGTKDGLATALAVDGPVHATSGNQNNMYGLPLTLARLPEDAAFGVFEIGMDHAGEIEPLSALLRPHLAIITTVAPVHLEFFESVEGIADAKAEIFAGLSPDGVAVLPRDNAHFPRLKAKAAEQGIRTIITFGTHAEADFRLIDAMTTASGTEIMASIFGKRFLYRHGIPGIQWATNSLAILAAVHGLGGDYRRASDTFMSMQAGAGRGKQTAIALPAGGNATLIDESYNANPDAVRAALAVLDMAAGSAGGRRLAVLGDMRELGPNAPQMHAGLADAVISHKVDRLFCCGPHMEHLAQALEGRVDTMHAAKSTGLIQALTDTVGPGDVVMVKGSLGTNMKPIVEAMLDLDAAARE